MRKRHSFYSASYYNCHGLVTWSPRHVVTTAYSHDSRVYIPHRTTSSWIYHLPYPHHAYCNWPIGPLIMPDHFTDRLWALSSAQTLGSCCLTRSAPPTSIAQHLILSSRVLSPMPPSISGANFHLHRKDSDRARSPLASYSCVSICQIRSYNERTRRNDTIASTRNWTRIRKCLKLQGLFT